MLERNYLPEWFYYPSEFKKMFDLNLTNLAPWSILDDDALKIRINGLKERFPEADLVPFAKRGDRDDIACWEKSGGNKKVFVFEDFDPSSWEDRIVYNSFWDWFKSAVNDMIEYENP